MFCGKSILQSAVILTSLCAVQLFASTRASGKNEVYKASVNERSVRVQVADFGFRPTPQPQLKTVAEKSRAEHPFSELNAMSYPDLVDLLVTIEWNDIPGLFSFSNGSYEFFIDSVRYQYMIDALDKRAKEFDGSNALGIPTLIEVLRAGSYLAWSNDELIYLRQNGEFVQNLIKPIRSIAQNSNISWENNVSVEVIQALGYCMGVGVCSPEIITDVTPIVEKFIEKQDEYLQDDSKRRSFYQIGNGINHGMINVEYFKSKETATAEFSPVLGNLLEAYKKLALYGSMGEDYLYLINNAVWWYGNSGMLTKDHQTIADNLLKVIDTYGKWEAPSLEALKLLTDSYKPYKDLNDLNVDEVKEELKAKLLPKFYRFDNGEFIFRCGADVTEKKVKQLYWALKEVRSQFFRYSLIHDPLEQGNADDSLTAIIYNNPDEYNNNNFLWGLSTNNGGMYIEGWGTFFTYERTPAQSIYSLEDLFRHELTHYLQGRYQTKGAWGAGIYEKDRLTWFEEGGAEFTSGSSRINGIETRLNMVEGLENKGPELMNLSDVVHATYGSGFTFYTYAFTLIHYLYDNDMKTLFRLIKACNNADAEAFDAIIAEMEANTQMAVDFEAFKKELVAKVGTFKNAGVTEDYFNVDSDKEINEVAEDIESFASMKNVETTAMHSEYFKTYRIRGTFEAFDATDTISDWKKMDSLTNVILNNLSDAGWKGYKTTVAYFANYRVEDGKALYDLTFEGMLNPGVSDINTTIQASAVEFKVIQNSSQLQISSNSAAVQKAAIYAINGRELMSFNLHVGENKRINLGSFPVGIYVLKIDQKKGGIVQKLVVK